MLKWFRACQHGCSRKEFLAIFSWRGHCSLVLTGIFIINLQEPTSDHLRSWLSYIAPLVYISWTQILKSRLASIFFTWDLSVRLLTYFRLYIFHGSTITPNFFWSFFLMDKEAISPLVHPRLCQILFQSQFCTNSLMLPYIFSPF